MHKGAGILPSTENAVELVFVTILSYLNLTPP